MMPRAEMAGAVRRAEEWRTAFAAREVEGREGARVVSTISVGLAQLRGSGESFAACLRRADEALYAAKNAGRNRVVTEDGADA